MRISKLKAIILLSSIFLVGCALTDNNIQPSPASSSSVAPIKTAPQSVDKIVNKVPEPESKIEEIVAANDYKQCQQLLSPSLVTNCEIRILSTLSFANNDSSWCGKSTDFVKNACLSTFNKKSTIEPANQIDQIVTTGDYLGCQELPADNKNTCEIRILTDKAISLKDPNWCAKSKSESVKSACLFSYNKI